MTMISTIRSPRVAPSGSDGLAASWYIALPSASLAGKPTALELFGEPLVAWRDGQGRPVIMPRHCPHMGASLALGKVVGGCLRCPFHHWTFAASGECVEIPGIDRIPAVARQHVYPVMERYGYVWIWYGTPSALFALPEFPALEADRRHYLAYRFCDETRGTPRSILENAYDYYHFITLHGLNVSRPAQLTLLSDDRAADNGPPIAAEARIGAILEFPMLRSHRLMFRALGMKGETFKLLVDGWPGGQRITFFADDREIYKELLAVTPVAANRTVQQGWALLRKTGRFWSERLFYGLFYLQHRIGTRQDLAIYDGARAERAGVHVKYDRGVLRFREHYQTWVDRRQS